MTGEEEERCVRLFLASINSDVTKREYLKNLDRFRTFTTIKKYSELLKIKEKTILAYKQISKSKSILNKKWQKLFQRKNN